MVYLIGYISFFLLSFLIFILINRQFKIKKKYRLLVFTAILIPSLYLIAFSVQNIYLEFNFVPIGTLVYLFIWLIYSIITLITSNDEKNLIKILTQFSITTVLILLISIIATIIYGLIR